MNTVPVAEGNHNVVGCPIVIAIEISTTGSFKERVSFFHKTGGNMGVSENSVPRNPMVLLIIIPIKWL